jgi:hypothetical protein
LEDAMRALIVYESMFGNTHAIADRIADGMRPTFDVSVLPVSAVKDEVLSDFDVVVVGGPTHVHGLPGRRSRTAAAEMATKDGTLTLEPAAVEPGLRDWFKGLSAHPGKIAVAFDTRARGPAWLTGHASKGIARRLRRLGFHVAGARSFLVGKDNRLLDGECDRAASWGSVIAAAASVDREDRPALAK